MIHYRPMSRADIPAGLELCRASRWNQLTHDWELFLQLSPRGCRVAVRNGDVIGTVTTVRYEERFAWIGMVLVDPSQRGQGVGTRLLHLALEILADMKSVRLDATPAGRPIYEKLDFQDEYWLSRMETTVSKAVLEQPCERVRLMRRDDLPEVFEMDREVFGADRRVVLDWMLAGAPELARIIGGPQGAEGYTFGRHGFSFEHVGPLVARTEESARQLLASCLSALLGRRLIVDASRQAAGWTAWLESLGFAEQRPFLRMFRGANNYPGRPERQFAILGPEFG